MRIDTTDLSRRRCYRKTRCKIGSTAPSNSRCHLTERAHRRQQCLVSEIKLPRPVAETKIQRRRLRGFITQPISWQCFAIWILLCRGANCADGVDVAVALMELPREILFDTRDAPLQFMAKRETTDGSSTTTITTGSASSTTGSSSSGATQTTSASFTLPSPFDHNLGNNFTSSTCPDFFSSFLKDPDFENCHPLSLLLGTSQAFFQAQRSLADLTQTLDASCGVQPDQCEAVMSKYARAITQPNTCGSDYQLRNPSVLQAYNGLIAYRPLYTAGCLKDFEGQYCFAAAATNTSSYQNNYIYYLPLGTQLSGGAQPACTQCLHDTMSVFAKAAGNRTQPLSMDYNNAAQQLDMNCGPTFVQAAVHSSSAAAALAVFSRSLSSSSGYLPLVTLLALFWSFW